MKLAETPPELQVTRRGYIDKRWTQLSDAATSFGEEAIKYLLVVNTAALGATLGFLGAMPHLRLLLWPRIVLLFFAFGVAVLGLYHSLRYHRIEWLYFGFRSDVNKYLSNEIEWNTLIDADEARVKRLGWLQVLLAYLSLVSFYAGLGIAGWNFEQVANVPGGSNDRPQITKPAATTADPKAGTQKNPPPNAGQGAGPSGKGSRP